MGQQVTGYVFIVMMARTNHWRIILLLLEHVVLCLIASTIGD